MRQSGHLCNGKVKDPVSSLVVPFEVWGLSTPTWFHEAIPNTNAPALCYNSRQGKIVMAGLTDRERKTLLGAAEKIHAYKLMQAKGYERLVKKAKDERTKQLLAGISADEFKDSTPSAHK